MNLFISHTSKEQFAYDSHSQLIRHIKALLSEYATVKKTFDIDFGIFPGYDLSELLKVPEDPAEFRPPYDLSELFKVPEDPAEFRPPYDVSELLKVPEDFAPVFYHHHGSFKMGTSVKPTELPDEDRRGEILEKLKTLYDVLKKSDLFELRSLALEIKSIFDKKDANHVFEIAKALHFFKQDTEKRMYKAVKQIKILAALLRVKLKRDIRSGYRQIVHFFFKNMDDNSGADTNTLYKNEMQTVLVNQQVNYNDTRRNNRVFRTAFE